MIKPVLNRSLRSKLKNQTTYNQKQKNGTLAPKEASVTKALEEIFILWDNLAKETGRLTPIKNKKRTTKKFKETCLLVKAFLNGTLVEHKLVVPPKFIDCKKFNTNKKTIRDFEQHLVWLKVQLLGVDYKPLIIKQKMDLHFFLGGTLYTGIPSILLTYCWEEPKRKMPIQNEDSIQYITEPWKLISGCKSFGTKDINNFDIYLTWALPHFKRLRNNLDSLKNFDDEIDVMTFFTFGVLRNWKEQGKSFSSNILNQDFFKTMMEDLRKKHGYTV